MRRSVSILAAAALAVVGATASFGPALAAPLAAPAVLNQADTGDNIVQVRHKKHHRKARHHHRKRVVVKNYYYAPYAYYPKPYHYYPHYYSKPGVSFSFSFGGGHRYRHW